MKSFSLACATLLVLGLSVSSAHAAGGDCTDKLLIDAVQAKCGADVEVDRGIIGHYMGEVTDTWIFSVKKGRTTKNLSIEAEGGNCVPETIGIKSDCP